MKKKNVGLRFRTADTREDQRNREEVDPLRALKKARKHGRRASQESKDLNQ